MTAPFLFAVRICFSVKLLIAVPVVDPSVSDDPNPASGSHCWQRSEAHGTWHGRMRILHTADFSGQ